MYEVFFSYARRDDQTPPNVYETTRGISNFYDKLVYAYTRRWGIDEKKAKNVIFFDTSVIELGSNISSEISKALKHTNILIAFISPSYFKSDWCFQEWSEFRRPIVGDIDRDEKKLIIPIEVTEIPDQVKKEVSAISGKHKEWVEHLTKNLLYISNTIFSGEDKAKEKDLINKVENICEKIKHYVDLSSEMDEPFEHNILVVPTEIVNSLNDSAQLITDFKGRYKAKPVLVIYAGGTVGMVKAPDSDEDHIDYIMAKRLDQIVDLLTPKLAMQAFDMVFVALKKPIDSSNIKVDDWNDLAHIIDEQMDNFQGFVILHGTNTLAYTASTLSFLLEGLEKPVIITGAEVPLEDLYTDAEHNVVNAIRAAAPDSKAGPMNIPEVCVYSGDYLYRGNRSTKKFASNRAESFYSPNMKNPLAAFVDDKLRVDLANREERGISNTPPLEILDAEIIVLLIYPEMNLNGYRALIDSYKESSKKIDGLILLSYGSGNTPDEPPFIEFVRDLLDQGVVVVNISQCQYGRVELKLFETNAILFDMGVINGGDMTLEAAYTKLMYLLSKYGITKKEGELKRINNEFQKNLRGELSFSAYTSMYRFSDFAQNKDNEVYTSDQLGFPIGSDFDRYDIEDAFIRLKGVKLKWDDIKGKPRVEFVLYYGQADRVLGFKGGKEETNALVAFKRTFRYEELDDDGYIKFDKNLLMTHAFRKNYSKNSTFRLQFGIVDSVPFTFESVQIIVYTRERQ